MLNIRGCDGRGTWWPPLPPQPLPSRESCRQHSLARAAITAAAVVVVVMVIVVVVGVAGKDSCSAATALPIGALCPGAWIFRLELISRARGDRSTGGSGGSGGGGVSIGKGSWSLARAVVCVVMGAIGKVFPTKELFMGASFSSRCHHTRNQRLLLLSPPPPPPTLPSAPPSCSRANASCDGSCGGRSN